MREEMVRLPHSLFLCRVLERVLERCDVPQRLVDAMEADINHQVTITSRNPISDGHDIINYPPFKGGMSMETWTRLGRAFRIGLVDQWIRNEENRGGV